MYISLDNYLTLQHACKIKQGALIFIVLYCIVYRTMGVQVGIEYCLAYPHKIHSMLLMNGSYGRSFSHAFQPFFRCSLISRFFEYSLSFFKRHPMLFFSFINSLHKCQKFAYETWVTLYCAMFDHGEMELDSPRYSSSSSSSSYASSSSNSSCCCSSSSLGLFGEQPQPQPHTHIIYPCMHASYVICVDCCFVG